MTDYDVLVVGAGPAGSSAAWRAASGGARVLLLDKAVFPRDKPCGDGLTPRALRSLRAIGLAGEVDRLHRIDRFRIFGGGRMLEFDWPGSEGFPDHACVVPRTVLDTMLLRHAQAAGAETRLEAEITAPLVEEGRVVGVRVRARTGGYAVRAPVVIAADGASSRIGRALGMTPRDDRPLGVAIRAQAPANRADEQVMEMHAELLDGKALLPGYGWVFPMGGGRVNVGVGVASTYERWRALNMASLMDVFLRSLPREWCLPDLKELQRSGDLKGWRLPMGCAVWPPWRPGVLLVGDAAGVINPFNGEGISEGIESGLRAAETALLALASGGPDDLSEYQRRLEELFGPYYRLARANLRVLSRPKVARTVTRVAMRTPPLMRFGVNLRGSLYYREHGRSVAHRTARGLLWAASRLRSTG
jgi:menaquinone-9 beta-reductase